MTSVPVLLFIVVGLLVAGATPAMARQENASKILRINWGDDFPETLDPQLSHSGQWAISGGLDFEGLTLIGDALPQGWSSGQERELTTDDSIPVLVPGTHITLRNVGDDPLVLLRLRISAQDPRQDAPSG